MNFQWLVYLAFCIAVGGSVFLVFKKYRFAILSVACCAIIVRVFVVLQDPFLHNWDERYHALVAKNMIEQPFQPTLRENPVLPFDYKDWTDNHIWLHKQPVFLWQIATSIYFFGANEFAVRLPDILLSAISCLLIFAIGKEIFNHNVGYIASIMFAFSFFQIEQVAGIIGMDHNDVTFAFYILLSIYLYLQYINKKSLQWAVLIGISVGLAVLNKWLTGIVIYGVWGLNILYFYKTQWNKQQIKHFVVSILSCLTIFLPWQLYIMLEFPQESAYVYHFNRLHITTALEGHSGNIFYHLQQYPHQYGLWTIPFLVVGIFLLFKRMKNPLHKTLFLFCIPVTYIFFSIIVETKSFAYVFYLAPLILILISAGIYALILFVGNAIYSNNVRHFIFVAVTILICLISLSFKELKHAHKFGSSIFIGDYRNEKIHNTEIYKQLDSLAVGYDIILNCKAMEFVDAMFYSTKNVYQWYPSETTVDSLLTSGYKIAAFKSFGEQILPDYILKNNDILIIDKTLW